MFTVVYIDQDGQLQHIKKRRADGQFSDIVQDLFDYGRVNPDEVLTDGDTVLLLWRDNSQQVTWHAPVQPKGGWSPIY